MPDKALPDPPAKIRHDDLFRVLLDDPGRADTLIRENLPPALAARLTEDPPKLLDGTYVDEAARASQSDRLFEMRMAGGQPALIYTLLEHKSEPDPGTPLQLLGYMVRIWTRYAETRAARLRSLPVIVPMVFYHGARAWAVPQSFAETITSDPDMSPFVPDFCYLLNDLGHGPVAALSQDAELRAGLAALRYALRSEQATREILTLILSGLPEGGLLEGVVFRYIAERYDLPHRDMTAVLAETRDDGGATLMGTMAQAWHAEGLAEGLAAGEAKGLAEGEAKGLATGKAKALTRLLTRRFGVLEEAARARIAAGSVADLDLWTDRLLEAPTLEAVFAPGPHRGRDP
ncbi:Rpn family recombination-promoting nuclease/putative transposase [Ruegeria sp.]|uniref:Rpn family recombination-promoting nuclease/putative transposase n=1 Tax=Ruegeria sp. TaxID=1879320 RepID=UPI003B007A43